MDLAKPKSGAPIFFFRTSQGHNALPRPGLELSLCKESIFRRRILEMQDLVYVIQCDSLATPDFDGR